MGTTNDLANTNAIRQAMFDSPVYQYALLCYTFLAVYKGTLEKLISLPVDLTAALFGILAFLWLIGVVTSRDHRIAVPVSQVITLLAFLFFVVAASYRSPVDGPWAFVRVVRFIAQDVVVMLYASSIPPNLGSVSRFMARMRRFLIWLGICMMVLMGLIPDPIYGGGKVVPVGSPPIALSFFLGLSAMTKFVDMVLGDARQRVTSLLLMMVFLAGMVAVNQRSPIFAIVAAAFAVILAAGNMKRSKRIGALVVVVFMMSVGAIVLFCTMRDYSRVALGISGNTAMLRVHYWHTAIDLFRRQPLLGAGPGAFALAAGIDPTFDESPHNVIIELLSEYGIFAAVLFCFFVIRATLVVIRLSRRPNAGADTLLVGSLLLYCAAQAPMSSRLFGWRIWWLLFALAYLHRDAVKEW